jgi:hypothetical protein
MQTLAIKKIEALVAVILLIVAAAIFLQPNQFLNRFSVMPIPVGDAVYSLFGFAAGCIVVAVALLFRTRQSKPIWALFLATSLAMYFLQTAHLSDWWVDDAGITFAYSRSFVDGHGLTFQPWHVAEEGYSSTLWMLVLALAGKMGYGIPAAAKFIGIASGCVAVALVIIEIRHRTGDLLAASVAIAVMMTAPFIVWSTSGQEHGLQALIMLLAALSLGRGHQALGTFWLAVLVFARPEAPLIVAACFLAALTISFKKGNGLEFRRYLPIVLVPIIAFSALVAFRVAYFDAPLPNPFYAKASGANFQGILNIFGGGWTYLLAFLTSSAAAIIVPLFFLKSERSENNHSAYLVAVLIGHLVFVIWAKGDWMGQYRFVMPILPIIGILVGTAIFVGNSVIRASGMATAIFLILSANTVLKLNEYKAHPTTPMSVVSKIGHEFARVAELAGIDDPLLAHHDAGAIAYDRSIRLLDLGGLVSRKIAKNLTDAAYLEKHVLIDHKPDFVFGAHNFAAASGFLESDTFAQNYIPLKFIGKPYMSSHYSHIRLDKINDADGLEIKYNDAGDVIEVVVR